MQDLNLQCHSIKSQHSMICNGLTDYWKATHNTDHIRNDLYTIDTFHFNVISWFDLDFSHKSCLVASDSVVMNSYCVHFPLFSNSRNCCGNGTLWFGHDFKDPAVNNNAPVLATGHQGPGRTPTRSDQFKSFVPRC